MNSDKKTEDLTTVGPDEYPDESMHPSQSHFSLAVIGVIPYRRKDGSVGLHVPNPKAHKEFIENIDRETPTPLPTPKIS